MAAVNVSWARSVLVINAITITDFARQTDKRERVATVFVGKYLFFGAMVNFSVFSTSNIGGGQCFAGEINTGQTCATFGQSCPTNNGQQNQCRNGVCWYVLTYLVIVTYF
jgi:hypothetical protein